MNCDIWNLFSVLIQILLSGIALGILIRRLRSQKAIRAPKTKVADIFPRHIKADILLDHRSHAQFAFLFLFAQRTKFKRLRLVFRLLCHRHNDIDSTVCVPDGIFELPFPQKGQTCKITSFSNPGTTTIRREISITKCGPSKRRFGSFSYVS